MKIYSVEATRRRAVEQCALRVSVLIICILSSWPALQAQSDVEHTPKLLLTIQRLRRLQRDRERQTVRWADFENRVQSVPDSRERGFELALFYAITHDANSGRRAVEWALAHKCELRQVALVLDWASDQASDSERNQLANTNCNADPGAAGSRDTLFLEVATGQESAALIEQTGKRVISGIRNGYWHDGAQLYAAIEYLYTARLTQHTDLRRDDPQFFSALPGALLLSLNPDQTERPAWRVHIAALALVGLDPNLSGSQYLQGWVMEDRQMIREGEGVAYELLWADPYLPGVGYENLDPWSYEPEENFFARTDWNTNACWVHISPAAIDQENCPKEWQQETMAFGRLTLIPLRGDCVPLPARTRDEAAIVWKIRPSQTVYFTLENARTSATADAMGMWKAPVNAAGNACTSPDKLKVPQAHKPARK